MDRDQMRASETDRQLVMDQLQQAVEDGRLDVAEYQQRVDAALNAKVYSELDLLLADLKRLPPPGYQDSQLGQPTTPMRQPPTVSRANERLREDTSARGRRWRAAGVATLIAAAIAVVIIVIWPEFLLYIAITVLVVLVLFVLAAVLGLF